MATAAQVQANRRNAQKSTGPRTPEGKAVVACNAVKHGLTGQEVVIQGEDPGEFEFYRERMLAELDPVGEVEAGLAERIVGLSWRLKRAERLQATTFDSLFARQKHSASEGFDKGQDADGDSTLGRTLVRDFAGGRVLDRLLIYERRIEHSLYRTMAELKRHRILSEVGPGKMWELRRALASEEGEGRENHGRDARATAADPPASPPAEGPTGSDAGMGNIVGGSEEADRGEPAGSVPVRASVSRASCPRFEGGLGPEGRCASGSTRIVPDGVTTNADERTPADGLVGAAERGSDDDAGMEDHGRDARATRKLHESSCKTKPIPADDAERQVSTIAEVTADSARDEAGETKPIARGPENQSNRVDVGGDGGLSYGAATAAGRRAGIG